MSTASIVSIGQLFVSRVPVVFGVFVEGETRETGRHWFFRNGGTDQLGTSLSSKDNRLSLIVSLI
jgi:hypothetical protein